MTGKSKNKSLKTRLLLYTGSSVLIVLICAGFGISYLFEQDVERRVESELNNYIIRLIDSTRLGNGSSVQVTSNPGSPRFDLANSGLYWQINQANQVVLTSNSLFDFELKLDSVETQTALSEYDIEGPQGQQLIVAVRNVKKQAPSGNMQFQFAVALDHNEVTLAVHQFAVKLAIGMVVLAFFLIISTWFQVTYGLKPLEKLGRQVAAIRDGRSKRISPDLPLEITPLVDEMNGLLQQQEAVMEKSRIRAGALAHGLKTPLAAISAEANKMRAEDQMPAASQIQTQICAMERHVKRELIRAKIRGSTHGIRSQTLVEPIVEGIIETLRRLPRGADINWQIKLPHRLIVAVESDDFAEVMGNLLDNSRKYATSQTYVTSESSSLGVAFFVHDDGSGIRQEHLQIVGKRGVSANDNVMGTGLGLAIVSDILDEYDGKLKILRSSLGGLCVRVDMPTIHTHNGHAVLPVKNSQDTGRASFDS